MIPVDFFYKSSFDADAETVVPNRKVLLMTIGRDSRTRSPFALESGALWQRGLLSIEEFNFRDCC
jgi:hypothetical protein